MTRNIDSTWLRLVIRDWDGPKLISQTFLGIKRTAQMFLRARELELKTYEATSGFITGEQGIK